MKTGLIIEDNEDNMVLITRLLEKYGYNVVRAGTGRQGIDIALTQKPDFIILDIQLPDIDGTEVLSEIRCADSCRHIPVIAMTSYAMTGDREKLLAAGCDGYVEKPIDPSTVIVQIQRVIGDNSTGKQPVPDTPSASIRGGPETVLIAEDDENLRTLMQTILQKYGYRVIEASDGQEAIDKFMEHRESIQLVISDLTMPKKSGTEVSSDIRKIRPDMQVIILSGHDHNTVTRNQPEEQNVLFLKKPVYPDILLLKIREMLDKG